MSSIFGNSDNNWLFGTSQDDYINGLGGNDQIYGGYGNDYLYGGNGYSYDPSTGQENGNDTVHGGWGNDTIVSGRGRDELYGDMGDDTFIITEGGPFRTTIDGGLGSDTLDFRWHGDGVFISLETGYNHDPSGPRFTSIENVIGSAQTDILYGSTKSNMMDGYHGDDRIWGRAGNDTLRGGAGDDDLDGQQGYDLMTGDAGADRFIFTQDDTDAADKGAWGRITDFDSREGDQIDLSEFGQLQFVGMSEFSHSIAGQVRIERDPWHFNRATIEIDLDGDGKADGHIDLNIDGFNMPTADDFIL